MHRAAPSINAIRVALDRDGFCILPELVPADQVARLRVELEQAAEERGLRRGGGVFGMRSLLQASPLVRELAASAPLMHIVEGVLGPGAFPVRGLFFDKTPQANWKVPWHQDLAIAVRERRDAPGFRAWSVKEGVPHVQPPAEVLARLLTIRLHLDACGAGDGPLLVLPGSHAVGRLSPAEIRQWRDRATPVACCAPLGGALLMRPLLLHASHPASQPNRRRVAHLEYAVDELPAGLEWAERPRE